MTEKKYKIDHDIVFKLASIHCTYEEIADVVGTSVSTLKKRFSKIIDKGRAEGKKSLRRAQFEAAVEKKDANLAWQTITIAKRQRNRHRKQHTFTLARIRYETIRTTKCCRPRQHKI